MASNLVKLDNSYNYNTAPEQALTNVYTPTFNISQSLNGSIISFFENITGDRASAEILASSIIATAYNKKINPVRLLDKLRNLTVQEQKKYLNYYLNTSRVGTSLLGSKKNAQVNKFVERSINYYNNKQDIVSDENILMLDAQDRLSYPGTGTSWFNIFGNNKFEFTPRVLFVEDAKEYLRFDGANYATGPSLGKYTTGDISVEVIIRVSSYSTDWVRIVGAGVTANRIFGLWYYSDGRILYQRLGTSSFNLFVNEKLKPGMWVHVVATSFYNSHTIYVNSVPVGQTQTSGTWENLNHPITLAYSNFHAYGKFDLAMVRLYSRALNPVEVADSYVRARTKVTI